MMILDTNTIALILAVAEMYIKDNPEKKDEFFELIKLYRAEILKHDMPLFYAMQNAFCELQFRLEYPEEK